MVINAKYVNWFAEGLESFYGDDGKTDPQYQKHLWKLSDSELFNLWLNIHNAREAYKNG